MMETMGQQLLNALNENERLRGEIEWLIKVLSDIHGDGRCPSWLCKHIEIILGDHVFLPEE